MCNTCPTRGTCKQICGKLKAVLDALEHSLKSNYIVKFFDPTIIENMRVDEPDPDVTRSYFKLVVKSLGVLTPDERYYVERYYGIHNNTYMSQCDLAKARGVAQHTVYYHLKKARRKLRVELVRRLPGAHYI